MVFTKAIYPSGNIDWHRAWCSQRFSARSLPYTGDIVQLIRDRTGSPGSYADPGEFKTVATAAITAFSIVNDHKRRAHLEISSRVAQYHYISASVTVLCFLNSMTVLVTVLV